MNNNLLLQACNNPPLFAKFWVVILRSSSPFWFCFPFSHRCLKHTKEDEEGCPFSRCKTSQPILGDVGNQHNIGPVLTSNLIHSIRVCHGRFPLHRHVCMEKHVRCARSWRTLPIQRYDVRRRSVRACPHTCASPIRVCGIVVPSVVAFPLEVRLPVVEGI